MKKVFFGSFSILLREFGASIPKNINTTTAKMHVISKRGHFMGTDGEGATAGSKPVVKADALPASGAGLKAVKDAKQAGKGGKSSLRERLEKNLLFFLFVLIVLLFVACIYIFLIAGNNKGSDTGQGSNILLNNTSGQQAGGQETPPPASNCGDGVCDNDESLSNSCEADCGKIVEDNTAADNVAAAPAEVCGDHICSNKEIDERSCAADCGVITDEKINPVDGGSCGDRICDNDEFLNKNCEKDCGKL
jgi:hypothetical protein